MVIPSVTTKNIGMNDLYTEVKPIFEEVIYLLDSAKLEKQSQAEAARKLDAIDMNTPAYSAALREQESLVKESNTKIANYHDQVKSLILKAKDISDQY